MKKIYLILLMLLSISAFAQDPTTSASTPSQAASDVVSIFSDAYTDVAGTDFYPNWGQSTTFGEVFVGTDTIMKYGNMNYQGVQFNPSLNVSSKGFLHFDLWTKDMTSIDIFLINSGPVEDKLSIMLDTTMWNSIDIDLADYVALGLSTSDVIQFKFVDPTGGGTIYMDNIYFYGAPAATEPAVAAPTPTHLDSNVLSIYSGAYTDVAGTNFNPNWGQSTVFSWFDISMDSMLKYSNLNYQGMALGGSIDVSNMEYLHLDVWSPNADSFNLFMINPGPVEHKVTPMLNTASWTSIDIPLTDYSSQGINLADIFQFKMDNAGNGTLFIDNIYFYKIPPIPTPMTAATAPTTPDSLVISLFSDVYTDVTVDTWRTSWSNATLTDEMIGSDNVKKYSALDFVGIETVGANAIDASSMKYFTFDAWTPDATTYRIKLVDFGADNAFGGGDDSEHEIAFESPALQTWNNHTIDLADFSGLTSTEHISQIIFSALPTGNSILYIDNVYFSRDAIVGTPSLNLTQLNIYPNPAKNTLSIVASADETISTIELTDLQGKSMILDEVNTSNVDRTIDISSLSSGVYMLSLNSEKGRYIQKVIVN